MQARAAEPQRGAAGPGRLRFHPYRTERVAFPAVLHRRAPPGSSPDRELLVQDHPALGERDAQGGVLVPVPAHRGLDHEPPAAQPVQRGQLLRAGQRVPQRADQRAGDQPDPGGGGGDRAEQDERARPRRGRVLVAGQRVVPRVLRAPGLVRRRPEDDVLADHDRVEPGPFGLDGELDQVGHVGGGPHGPVLGQDQDDADPAHEWIRTGRYLSPLVKLDRIRRGSPASSNRLTRRARAASTTLTSSRARCTPRHRCGPPRPKDRCRFGLRPTSKTSGSANSASSRFPDKYQRITLSPARIAAPPSSVSAAAVRRMKWVGQLHRFTSSTAASSRPGSPRSRSHCSGCWQKANTPWAIAIRVVSLPATTKMEKKLSRSVSLSRSPSTSARSSLDSRSSPGWSSPAWRSLSLTTSRPRSHSRLPYGLRNGNLR